MKISIMRWPLAGFLFAAAFGSSAAIATVPLGELIPLSADFNDKTPGQLVRRFQRQDPGPASRHGRNRVRRTGQLGPT